MKEKKTIDLKEIMQHLPHRYPFLMIDKIVDVVSGESAVGIKNVTCNEQFFQGHFPGHPVMPGVLIVEAMAQTAGVVVMDFMNDGDHNKLVYFMTIENARFRRPVVPGDQLHIHVQKKQSRGNVWKFESKAMVDDTVVAEATYSAMIVDSTA